MKAGYSMAEAERIIQQAVQLFMETRQEWLKTNPHAVVPLCLGACGPYGAYLADGSEYRGHYDVSDETWIDFHTKRAQLLWESGADLLLFETEPSLHEALIEAEIAETMKADYWSVFHVKMVAILVKEPPLNPV